MKPLYRLTTDIDGQEDIRDFTELSDAKVEFKKSTRIDGWFSSAIDEFNQNTFEHVRRVAYAEYEGKVGATHLG